MVKVVELPGIFVQTRNCRKCTKNEEKNHETENNEYLRDFIVFQVVKNVQIALFRSIQIAYLFPHFPVQGVQNVTKPAK